MCASFNVCSCAQEHKLRFVKNSHHIVKEDVHAAQDTSHTKICIGKILNDIFSPARLPSIVIAKQQYCTTAITPSVYMYITWCSIFLTSNVKH